MIKDGIINIYKPQNMTSQDVVSILRKTLNVRKVGHTGTLDPMATGVLLVCIGKATRIMEYLNFDLKIYRATLELGKVTDTQDVWGDMIECNDFANITESDVRKAFSSFRGVIEQSPSIYSALKLNGKKLYEYAREGQELPKDIKKRKIYIHDIHIQKIDLTTGQVEFDVTCSKGTYIRTICHDIGQILGCGACMSALERRRSGVFVVDNSITLEELKDAVFALNSETFDRIENLRLPIVDIDYPLTYMGIVSVNEDGMDKFINGVHLPKEVYKIESEPTGVSKPLEHFGDVSMLSCYKVYNEAGDFLGICHYDTKYNKMLTDKVFYRKKD